MSSACLNLHIITVVRLLPHLINSRLVYSLKWPAHTLLYNVVPREDPHHWLAWQGMQNGWTGVSSVPCLACSSVGRTAIVLEPQRFLCAKPEDAWWVKRSLVPLFGIRHHRISKYFYCPPGKKKERKKQVQDCLVGKISVPA